MKKYNRDKRSTRNANTRKIRVNEIRDTREYDIYAHIHIHAPQYDGYKRTQYDNGVFTHKRKSKEQRYIDTMNAINDIFPELNGEHHAHIYRANAQYHAFIPPRTNKAWEEERNEEDFVFTHLDTIDTRTAKCIIFNEHDEIIYIGKIRRTIKTYIYGGENGKPHAEITLHKGDRDMRVRPYIPLIDTIHGVSIEYIRAQDVELYHI